MSFSFPLFTAAAAAAIALLAGVIYLIIYQARINWALRSGASTHMAAPRTVLGIAAVIIFAGAVFVSYLAGYKAAYDDLNDTSSPAVEIPPMTMRDLSALPAIFDAALEHVESDGADLTNARASLSDLSFLRGRFSYLSFMLYYDGADGERISRSVDVSGAGSLFTEWWPSENDEAAENSIPLNTLRQLLAALDAIDWPDAGESQNFNSLFGVVNAQEPGGYVLEGGELIPSVDAEGEYLLLDYVSGDQLIWIYISL